MPGSVTGDSVEVLTTKTRKHVVITIRQFHVQVPLVAAVGINQQSATAGLYGARDDQPFPNEAGLKGYKPVDPEFRQT